MSGCPCDSKSAVPIGSERESGIIHWAEMDTGASRIVDEFPNSQLLGDNFNLKFLVAAG